MVEDKKSRIIPVVRIERTERFSEGLESDQNYVPQLLAIGVTVAILIIILLWIFY